MRFDRGRVQRDGFELLIGLRVVGIQLSKRLNDGALNSLVFERAAVTAERVDQAVEHFVAVRPYEVAETEVLQGGREPVSGESGAKCRDALAAADADGAGRRGCRRRAAERADVARENLVCSCPSAPTGEVRRGVLVRGPVAPGTAGVVGRRPH
jgi:hypothetical protein